MQWKLDITKGQGADKKCSLKEVSLHRGSFSYILLLLGLGIWFVMPRNS